MSKAIKKCPCCNSTAILKDLDYPKTMLGCTKCGADFLKDGEIIFDPREIEDPKPKNGTQRSPFGIGS